MKFLRSIVVLLAAFFLLTACQREEPLDSPVGSWEISRVLLLIQPQEGSRCEVSTLEDHVVGRLEFKEDETLVFWTRWGCEWVESGSGEWSYAAGRLTLYLEDSAYPCTVEKLTHEQLLLKMALPEMNLIPGMATLEIRAFRL